MNWLKPTVVCQNHPALGEKFVVEDESDICLVFFLGGIDVD